MVRLLPVFAFVALVLAAAPAWVGAQDFEPIDLRELQRILDEAEAAGIADDPGPARPDPGAPDPAVGGPGSGAGSQPGDPESDAAFVRRLLERLRARGGVGAADPEGAGGRSGFLTPEEEAALAAVRDRLGLAGGSPAVQEPRFRLSLGWSLACVRGEYSSYGRYGGVGGVLPAQDGSALLSANPLPPGAPVAWLDARAPAPGCGGPGWFGAIDADLHWGLFVGVGVSGTRADHDLVFEGAVPSLLVWGTVHSFAGTALVGSVDRRALFRAGWRVALGRTELYALVAPGWASVAFDVAVDAEGSFYAPGSVSSFSGSVPLPAAPALVVAERTRTLPVVHVGGGLTRWMWRFMGVGVEATYFRTFSDDDARRPAVDPQGPSGLTWSYAPQGWAVDAGVRFRF